MGRSILYCIIFILLLWLIGQVAGLMPGWSLSKLTYGTLGALAALGVTWLFLKNEGHSFKSIGLHWELATVFRFIKGLLWGAILFAIMLNILLATTSLHLQKSTDALGWPASLAIYALMFPAVMMEEVAFRGYPFVTMQKQSGVWVTQLIMAVIFALYHVVSGWTFYDAFTGPFTWAFIFGAAALWSGGIAVPAGIHFSINVLQVVFGIRAGAGSIFILQPAEATVDGNDYRWISLAIQVLILLIGVIGTARYQGKHATKNKPAVL